jgi:hypothetical protein
MSKKSRVGRSAFIFYSIWQNIFLAVLYYGTVVIVGVAVGLQTHNGFHAITFVLRHQP